MNNIQRLESLADEAYQEIFGVTKVTFEKMLSILKDAYEQQHARGGRPNSRLSILDKLIIMLGYYREYRTMRHIAFDYGVSKSIIHKSIEWVENVLVKSGEFALPSKKKLTETQDEQVVLLDATECEIERPKKTEKILFRQEEKTHVKSPNCCRCINSGCYMCFCGRR